MKNKHIEEKIIHVLERADIELNGRRSWDIRIHDSRFYKRVFQHPSLGLGESYMEGWWDCDRLDEFFFRIMRQINPETIYSVWTFLRFFITNFFTNQQSKLRSTRVAKRHYNLDNNLYRYMLGETMAYTCGYWKDTKTLDDAQNSKYNLVCKKVNLKSGDKVLELGCGWGGFARYAAKNYGCQLVSVNIAAEQMKYAAEICKGLPIQLFVCDYRDIGKYNPQKIKFDKVISIGMCEHVGHKNYPHFLQLVRDNIKEDGLFLLHTIGKNKTTSFSDPWMQKYIFPSGMLPSVQLLSRTSEGRFVIEDLHNFGSDYDKTLMAWHENFEKYWPVIKMSYDERFYRMWRYYLLSCAGAFRARTLQLWQLMLSPKGQLHGYSSIR